MTREQILEARAKGYAQVCEHTTAMPPCPATSKSTYCLTCNGPLARLLLRPHRAT